MARSDFEASSPSGTPLRILHLIDTKGPGGAETVFLTLITSLGAEWESIPVVAGPGWVEDSVREAGFTPLMIPFSSGPFDLPYLRQLSRTIREQRIDLIQTHLLSTTLYGGMAGRLQGIPVLGTFHGDPDLRATGWQGKVRYGLIRTGTEQVVCVSSSLKARTMAHTGFQEDDVTVIPNGIDTESFRPGEGRRLREKLGITSEALLVGSVGNVRPAKDYQTLLRTAHRVKAVMGPKVKFVVAGQRTRPLFDELESLQRELELEDTVEFLGFRDDVPELLRALDLAFLSSTHEGFSLVVVQAMATGLPVVSTRCGGPEEIFTHEEEGLFCPPGDPEALADGILRLREDPVLRRSMGERGRETAEKRFSQDAMVHAYEELYRTILGGSRGRRQ